MVRPATPGTIVVLGATIVLILVSVSTPIVKSIHFLQADLSVSVASVSIDGAVKLGVFGYCVEGIGSKAVCQGPQLGYELDSNQIFGNNTGFNLPNSLIKWLTYALIIHPIAAGLAALAFISGVLSHFREMSRSRLTTWIASLATTVAMLAFVFDIVLFSIAKSRINSASNKDVGLDANLGNGIWLTLVGFILLAVSGCFFGFGHCCMNRRPRQEEKDRMRPQMDQVHAASARRDAEALAGTSSGLPSFPEEEAIPLTANKSMESLHEHDISGVGTGYGRGPGAEYTRELPPVPRRQESADSYVRSNHTRQQTPSQSTDYRDPYVPNMYSVSRTPAPLTFPTPQSAGAGPMRSPTYPPQTHPMTAPLAPVPWTPPVREDAATPYRHQSTPFAMPYERQQAYGHQQSASTPYMPSQHARQQSGPYPVHSAQSYPVTLDQGESSFYNAATRHRSSHSENYAPQQNYRPPPSSRFDQPPVASPPIEIYESYYNESPTAIPYLNDSHTPSPSYHTGGDPYLSYGGSVHR